VKKMTVAFVALAAAAAIARGQDGTAELEKKAAELRTRMAEIEKGLQQASQRLGLVPAKDKGTSAPQDEEIAKLREQAETAKKAVEHKALDILKADQEANRLLARIEEIKATMANLEKELKEAEKSLGSISERLGLAAGKGRKEGGAAGENPEIAALRQAAQAAQKALEDKMAERLRADPEGARLLAEREEIQRQISELRQQAQGRKEGRKR